MEQDALRDEQLRQEEEARELESHRRRAGRQEGFPDQVRADHLLLEPDEPARVEKADDDAVGAKTEARARRPQVLLEA